MTQTEGKQGSKSKQIDEPTRHTWTTHERLEAAHWSTQATGADEDLQRAGKTIGLIVSAFGKIYFEF